MGIEQMRVLLDPAVKMAVTGIAPGDSRPMMLGTAWDDGITAEAAGLINSQQVLYSLHQGQSWENGTGLYLDASNGGPCITRESVSISTRGNMPIDLSSDPAYVHVTAAVAPGTISFVKSVAVTKGGSFAANDARIGATDWQNVNGALGVGGLPATWQANDLGTSSHYLTLHGFGFAIPRNATIRGVLVEVDKYVSGQPPFGPCDNSVKLIVAPPPFQGNFPPGVISGADKARPSQPWPTSAGLPAPYGSSTDLWGLALTPINFNSPNFGIAFSAQSPEGNEAMACVDNVRVTVNYSFF